MKKLSILLVLASLSGSCQDFGKLEVVADLPGLMKEVSGIEKFPDDPLIWMINDSRNPPHVYGFNLETQKVEKVIHLKNGSNIDWEDLAKDSIGNLYVGDFGNNASLRTDLTIYSIPKPGSSEKRRNEAIITTFKYEDQVEFPPKKKDISYDVESFIHLNGYFYLFTRNRAKKFDGSSRVYRLPAREGDFIAEFVGTIKTCDDQSDCEITSAAIHHPSGKIALLSYNKVWIIDEYIDDEITKGKMTKYKLEHTSQKESVCFISENELYIADERSRGEGRNLYLLKLNE